MVSEDLNIRQAVDVVTESGVRTSQPVSNGAFVCVLENEP